MKFLLPQVWENSQLSKRWWPLNDKLIHTAWGMFMESIKYTVVVIPKEDQLRPILTPGANQYLFMYPPHLLLFTTLFTPAVLKLTF